MQTSEKIGRRKFGATLATAALASTQVRAQTPAPTADAALKSARQDLQQDARAIAQVPLPRTVEPAFRFKP